MAEQKTKPTEKSVESFLDALTDEGVRDDCYTLMELMQKVTGSPPVLWGPSIIGFGRYNYKYESGHEGYSCLAAFSPRKSNLTVYFMSGATGQAALLKKLGKHKASKACLYFKKLEDIDLQVLEKLIVASMNYVKKKFPDKKS